MVDVDVAAIRAGHEPSFLALVRSSEKLLLSVAWSLLLNREDAQDAVQESFLRLWRSRDRLREDGNILAYLVRIVRNVCLTMLKQRRIDIPVDEVPLQSRGHAVDERLALQQAVAHAMASLSEEERMVIALVHEQGMDSREAGQLLGISASTVRGRYQAARVRMRNLLIRRFPEVVR